MSVRGRLTLWYGGAMILLLGAFSGSVFLFVRGHLLAGVQREVDDLYARIEAVCRHDPDEVYEIEKHGPPAFFEVRDGDRIVHRTASWSEVEAPKGREYRVKRGASGPFMIAVAADETPTRDAVRLLGLVFLIGVPLAAGAALGGGYVLAGRALAPVGTLADRAREITAERLAERLPVGNPRDEFGRLAGVFNETLSRLQGSFDQLRRFTADASHELRTPLTALRSVGEVALQQDRNAASYREVIGSMLEEVDRLSRLVDSLLFLTRADAGVIRAAPGRADTADLAKSTVELLRVLAEERRQTIHLEAGGSMIVLADPTLLRQALMNLIDNAIKYSPVGGSIRVRTHRVAGAVLIDVIDSGPGIPEEGRKRLFERFHRLDPSRSREGGGAGLGLAIARWAVEASGGNLTLASSSPEGSTFRISLPSA